MLKDKSSSAIVAVSDIARARDFYGSKLGLEVVEDMDQVLTFKTGDTFLVVYVSKEAGTNRANAAVWGVGNEIDANTAGNRSSGTCPDSRTASSTSMAVASEYAISCTGVAPASCR